MKDKAIIITRHAFRYAILIFVTSLFIELFVAIFMVVLYGGSSIAPSWAEAWLAFSLLLIPISIVLGIIGYFSDIKEFVLKMIGI